MKRVTGLGGVFFKCEDVEKIKQWYREHLGIESDQYGGMFTWRDVVDPQKQCITAWSPFTRQSTYFSPSEKPFMFNYRVENLVELLAVLKNEGVPMLGEVEECEYGKFGWVMDPEGNKVELWEPVDAPLLK